MSGPWNVLDGVGHSGADLQSDLDMAPVSVSDRAAFARAPRVLDYSVVYYGARWRQNVLDNAAVVALHDVPIAPGSHTLTITALDPGVILDRIEIDFAGASHGYDPIPETRIQK